MVGKTNMAEREERREFARVDAIEDGRLRGSATITQPPWGGLTPTEAHDAYQRFQIRVMGTRIGFEEKWLRCEVIITRDTSETHLRRKANKAVAKKLRELQQDAQPQSTYSRLFAASRS